MTANRFDDALDALSGKLIISCQDYIETMIPAAVQGGAAALRINGPRDVRFARARCELPVLGCNKVYFPNCEMYITPSVRTAVALRKAGADIVAVDARDVRRPRQSLAEIIETMHELDCPVVADVATFEEGQAAVAVGADIVATTFAPSFSVELVAQFANAGWRVLAEGNVDSPEKVSGAISAGAWAVCVGTAITRPHLVASRFREVLGR